MRAKHLMIFIFFFAGACRANSQAPSSAVVSEGSSAPAQAPESSSTAPAPQVPDATEVRTKGGAVPLRTGVQAFSSVAIAIKLGVAGPGIDVATPIASKMNLRVGASFFSYNPNFNVDGISIVGDIELRSITEAFDWFPFGNALRISPGVTFYNGNHINAVAVVAGGQGFSLNDVSYVSDAANPVTGSFDMSFGHQLAPSLTIGFGNMIPRKGGHWAFPFEVGAEYIGVTPRIALNLVGSACTVTPLGSNCQAIASTPQLMINVAGEQASINADIPKQLRFFPILSTGVSYRFGRSHDR